MIYYSDFCLCIVNILLWNINTLTNIYRVWMLSGFVKFIFSIFHDMKMCAHTSVTAYEVLTQFQRGCGNMAIIHLQYIIHNGIYTNVQSNSEINRELENGRQKIYYNGTTLFYLFVEKRDFSEKNYFLPFQRFWALKHVFFFVILSIHYFHYKEFCRRYFLNSNFFSFTFQVLHLLLFKLN